MKRALTVAAGTVAGLAAVLALNPEARTVAASAGAASTSTSTSSGSSAGTSGGSSGTSGSATDGASGSGSSGSSSASGTYTGDAIDVGRNYGTMQVEITVENGVLTGVTALAVPQNDPRSAEISNWSVPELVSQALEAKSASIAGLSGATYTSNGFAQSLTSALQQAGLA